MITDANNSNDIDFATCAIAEARARADAAIADAEALRAGTVALRAELDEARAMLRAIDDVVGDVRGSEALVDAVRRVVRDRDALRKLYDARMSAAIGADARNEEAKMGDGMGHANECVTTTAGEVPSEAEKHARALDRDGFHGDARTVRAYELGVAEGERRAKAKATELHGSWTKRSVKCEREAKASRGDDALRQEQSAATFALCALHIRTAFGLPADPGQSPPGGEPAPEEDGFPLDVPPEVDEHAAEIAAIVDERVTKVLEQRRARITSDLTSVIVAGTSENLMPHEIAYRVLRRMEHAHGFGAPDEHPAVRAAEEAPVVPGAPSADERAAMAAGKDGPLIPHEQVMAGVRERAHADGIVDGLRAAAERIRGVATYAVSGKAYGRSPEVNREIADELTVVADGIARDVYLASAPAAPAPHVDRAALLALAEGWERARDGMPDEIDAERARIEAGKESRYMLGFNTATWSIYGACARALRRLLDAPRGPGGGEREPAGEKPAAPASDAAPDREQLGREVRDMWVAWAHEQPDPKASWLVPWERLSAPDQEVDRRIGERLFAMGVEAERARRDGDMMKFAAELTRAEDEPGGLRRIADREMAKARELIAVADGIPRMSFGPAEAYELMTSWCDWCSANPEHPERPGIARAIEDLQRAARINVAAIAFERAGAQHARISAGRKACELEAQLQDLADALDKAQAETADWASRFRQAEQRASSEMVRAQNVEAKLTEMYHTHEAERDTAYQRGQEEMRERAARQCRDTAHIRQVAGNPDDARELMIANYAILGLHIEKTPAAPASEDAGEAVRRRATEAAGAGDSVARESASAEDTCGEPNEDARVDYGSISWVPTCAERAGHEGDHVARGMNGVGAIRWPRTCARDDAACAVSGDAQAEIARLRRKVEALENRIANYEETVAQWRDATGCSTSEQARERAARIRQAAELLRD